MAAPATQTIDVSAPRSGATLLPDLKSHIEALWTHVPLVCTGVGGTSTVYTATVSPTPAALVAGMLIVFEPNATCGSSPSLNINGLGAKAIVDQDGDALAAGQLVINRARLLRLKSFSGTLKWEIIEQVLEPLLLACAAGALLGLSSLSVGSSALRAFASVTPAAQVHGGSASAASFGIGRWSNDTSGPTLRLAKSRSATIGANAAVTGGEAYGQIYWDADYGTGFAPVGWMGIRGEGTVTGATIPGQFIFQSQDAAGTMTERLRLWASGLVTFGNINVGLTATAANEFKFSTNGVIRVTVDGSGRALVGGSSSIAGASGAHHTVQVDGFSSGAGQSIRRWSADAAGPTLALGKSRAATAALGTPVATGDDLLAIDALGDDGTSFVRGAAIRATVAATPTTGVVQAFWDFMTNNGSALAARLRITAAGDVGIGTSSPTTRLDVAGAVRISGGGQFTVATLPSASAYGAGAMIYVSNGASNQRLAISDGTSWRFQSGAVVS